MIPKNIIQLYLGEYGDESEYLFYLSEAWSSMPGWDHILYKNEEVDNLVRDYSDMAYKAYCKIPSLSYRCDLARLIAIYKNGGMYLDLDTRPNPNIDIYQHLSLNGEADWGFCFEFISDRVDSEGRPHNIEAMSMNHVFVAEKESQLIKKMIDDMVKQILEVDDSQNITFSGIVSTHAWAKYVQNEIENIIHGSYKEHHRSLGYSDFGVFWINSLLHNKIKTKKFRNGVFHVGSIILKDFLDTNNNKNSLKEIADLYSQIELHNGELKIYSSGGGDGFST